MAAPISFKQECPSCEALVPIRDASLVGKKIDCPKCKFRFAVEAPPEAEEKDAKPAKGAKTPAGAVTNAKPGSGKTADKVTDKAAPAAKKGKGVLKKEKPDEDDDAPQKKKKKKSSMTLVLGVGVGVVAVGGLILAAVSFWPTGGSSPNKGNLNVNRGGPGPIKPVTPSGNETKVETAPDKGTNTAASNIDVGNLLPNDTETVVSLNVPGVLSSSLRTAALRTAGAFQQDAFLKSFGFPLDDVERVLLAYGPKNGVLSVLRTKKPFQREKVTAALQLEAQPPVNKLNLQLIKNPLDGLGKFFVKGNVPRDAAYVHILDDQTLVFGNKAVLEQFLTDGAKPKFLTQPAIDPNAKPEEKKTSSTKRVGEGEGEDEYQLVFFQGTRPGPDASQPPMPKPPPPPIVASASFLTVKPALKSVLDKANQPTRPALVLIATSGQSTFSAEIVRRLKEAIPLGGFGGLDDKELAAKGDPLRDVQAFSVGIQAFNEGKLQADVALEARDEKSGTKLEESLRLLGSLLPYFLKGTLDLEVNGLTPAPSGMTPSPTPEVSKARDGELTLVKADNALILSVELSLKQASYDPIMYKLSEFFVQLKSRAELADARSHVHELAAALQAYVKEKKAFPRGTVARQTTGGRKFPYPPNERLSWMTELLPYLGDGSYRNIKLDPNAAWWEGDNFLAAQMIVPPFLGRTRVDQPAQVQYPSIATPLAATNFAGMAGVGLDAAEYSADDPAVKDKLGVFGYERITKTTDVTGGLDKVIVLIQVPATHKTPWIAGGGSTVRGISDDPTDASAIKPFVCTEYQGKRGTLAIMGDGKVRFFSETTPNDTFRALCTLGGGKTVAALDPIAPVIPPPTDGSATLKTQPLPMETKTPAPTETR